MLEGVGSTVLFSVVTLGATIGKGATEAINSGFSSIGA